MARSRARLLATCILLAISSAPGVVGQRSDVRSDGASVAYRLSFPAPQQRWMEADVTFSGVIGRLEVRMSRSSPGRYALHEFARHVYDVRAGDGRGRPLPVVQHDPHEWHVEGHDGTVRFQYRLHADRVDGTFAAVDETHAHLNMPAALVWARGFEQRPATVTVVPPHAARWKPPATQLFGTDDPWTFTAPNLQYLMDSPLESSAFSWRTFRPRRPQGVEGPLPTIALAVHHTGTEADVDRFQRDLEAVVPETAAVFGEYPAFEGERFLFIADYLPWATGDGMEHRNSTVLTSSTSIAGGRQRLMETAVHEFVHAWNVERIRPQSLEPFDFTRANPSRDLWFAEGVTNYYMALVMHRAGLSSLTQFVADIGGWVGEVRTSPAHAFRSAEEMSLLAPLVDGIASHDSARLAGPYISHYTFGAALGVGFDLAIRDHTGGRRSLDDVMRVLWVRHGRPGGSRPGYVDHPYTGDDLVRALAEVTDPAFASSLMDRFVRGREVMDYARLLPLAGLVLRPASPGARTIGPVALGYDRARLRIAAAPPIGSPADRAGLAEGDVLVAVDGRPVMTVTDFEDAVRKAPSPLTVRVERRGRQAPIEITVATVPDPAVTIVAPETGADAPTPAQLAFRTAWLGSRAR